MFKKLFAIIILLSCSSVFAKEIEVKITPQKIYSTCNNEIKEGDILNFVTTKDIPGYKKGSLVQGLLTERTENGFGGTVATLYIEQFKINGKPLKGIIYQKGNPHSLILDNFAFTFIRGGEAFLKPDKDIFTLNLEVK